MLPRTRTRTHPRTHAHTHTHTRARAHTHTHAHTRTRHTEFHEGQQHHDDSLGGFDDAGMTNGGFEGEAHHHDQDMSDDPYAAISAVDEEMAEPEAVR